MSQSSLKRDVADCPYRKMSGSPEDGQPAVCQLLAEISGVEEEHLLEVEREACDACCNSFAPTPEDWNPVIASLLSRVAASVSSANGVDGCTVEQAELLAEAAIRSLPVVLPDEDDGVDDIQSFVPPQQITVDELRRILPLPERRTRPETSEPLWAVGVTTAPRRQPTLSTCLESLIGSGWNDPHLFVDGDVDVDTDYNHLSHTSRPTSIGAWPAWCEALRELLSADPSADVIAVFQDDSLLPGLTVLKDYINSVLWPGDGQCIISLYTSTDDMVAENIWRPLPGVWKYGAVALVFPPDIARQLLASADSGELDFVQGTAGIDSRIGVWADRMGISIWHPSPSLIQHIGQVSSVWKQSRAVGLRRANRFLGSELSADDS